MTLLRRNFIKRVIRRKMKEEAPPREEKRSEISISRRKFITGLFATGALSLVKGVYTGEEAPDETYEFKRGRFLSVRAVHTRDVNGKKVPVYILPSVHYDAKKEATLIKLPSEGSQVLIDYHSLEYLKDRLRGHSVVLFHLPSQEEDARAAVEELTRNGNVVKLVPLPKELEEELQKDKGLKPLAKSVIASIGALTPLAALRYAIRDEHADPVKISLNRRDFLKLAAWASLFGYVGLSSDYFGKMASHASTLVGREGLKPEAELIFHPTGGGKYLNHLWNEIPKHVDPSKEAIAVFRTPYLPPGKLAYYLIRGLFGRHS